MIYLFLLAQLVLLSAASDCSEHKDPGDYCDQPAGRMFYYDTRYKVCQPFQYHGCNGNGNRFATAAECKDVCVNGNGNSRGSATNASASDDVFVPRGNSHDQWRKADKCGSVYLIPDGKYISCSPSCPPNHSCTNGVCCPSKDYVCSLRDDTGTFADGIEDRPRFGWNHDVKSCVRFSYYGARGNYNNFPNFPACMEYCKDSKPLQA